MKNVSFIKSPEEVQHFINVMNESRETQEGLSLVWETDLQILKKIIPPPLVPSGPFVMANICYLNESDIGKDYYEGILLVPVMYNKQPFAYYLGMSLAGKSDMPVFLGREQGGFPKKNTEGLSILRNGDYIKVSIKRHGIRFFEAEAKIGNFNHPNADKIYENYKVDTEIPGNGVNFKYDLDYLDNTVGFTRVKLVNSATTTIYHSIEKAHITKIKLTPSQDDPWAELKVLQPLGAIYYKCNVVMYPAKTLLRLDPNEYAPYLFAGWDSSVLGQVYRNFKAT